VSTVCC